MSIFRAKPVAGDPARSLLGQSVQDMRSSALLLPGGKIQLVVITPVRNEALYLDEHISSVMRQTIRPTESIIVDDGSTDTTGAIVDGGSPNIHGSNLVHRHDRGFRHAGHGSDWSIL